MSALVSVVLVAYNSADDLAELLPRFHDPRLDVIVLDNASPDDGLLVAAQFPWLRSVAVGHNSGWTAACNEGARLAHAPSTAFVNPDVRVGPDELVRLASALGPGVASVSPRFRDLRGVVESFAFRFPDPVAGLFVFLNAGQRMDRLMGSHFVRRRTYNYGLAVPEEPDHVGAACLVVGTREFLASGGFDERMWLFFSDMEWALRQRGAGHRHLVVPEVEVVHEGGGSVGHMTGRQLSTTFQRDYLAYAALQYSRSGRLISRVGVWTLVGFLPAVAAVLRRDIRAARACLAQARDVLR